CSSVGCESGTKYLGLEWSMRDRESSIWAKLRKLWSKSPAESDRSKSTVAGADHAPDQLPTTLDQSARAEGLKQAILVGSAGTIQAIGSTVALGGSAGSPSRTESLRHMELAARYSGKVKPRAHEKPKQAPERETLSLGIISADRDANAQLQNRILELAEE